MTLAPARPLSADLPPIRQASTWPQPDPLVGDLLAFAVFALTGLLPPDHVRAALATSSTPRRRFEVFVRVGRAALEQVAVHDGRIPADRLPPPDLTDTVDLDLLAVEVRAHAPALAGNAHHRKVLELLASWEPGAFPIALAAEFGRFHHVPAAVLPTTLTLVKLLADRHHRPPLATFESLLDVTLTAWR